jgi:hypothetical protein
MTVLAIHQPEFMPWLGFYYKLHLADRFVILDHVQYKRRYYENRNRVVSPQGKVVWLTVPVISKGLFNQPINQVAIAESPKWRRSILETLRHFYHQAPGFNRHMPKLEAIFKGGHGGRLVELNLALLKYMASALDINTPFVKSSELNGLSGHTGSDLILRICQHFKATQYLFGALGTNYLDRDAFSARNIQVRQLSFNHPVYPQLCSGFVSKLSAIDYLFNTEPGAKAGTIFAS